MLRCNFPFYFVILHNILCCFAKSSRITMIFHMCIHSPSSCVSHQWLYWPSSKLLRVHHCYSFFHFTTSTSHHSLLVFVVLHSEASLELPFYFFLLRDTSQYLMLFRQIFMHHYSIWHMSSFYFTMFFLPMTFLITIETASCTSLLMFFYFVTLTLHRLSLLFVALDCGTSLDLGHALIIASLYFICSYTSSATLDRLIWYLSFTFMDNTIVFLANDLFQSDQQWDLRIWFDWLASWYFWVNGTRWRQDNSAGLVKDFVDAWGIYLWHSKKSDPAELTLPCYVSITLRNRSIWRIWHVYGICWSQNNSAGLVKVVLDFNRRYLWCDQKSGRAELALTVYISCSPSNEQDTPPNSQLSLRFRFASELARQDQLRWVCFFPCQ